MIQKIVKIKGGEVTLMKPTAGMRNKAIVKSEVKGEVKNTLLFQELLAVCVRSHPFGTIPIRQALDNMELEDYDLLLEELKNMIQPSEETKKKLPEESNQE